MLGQQNFLEVWNHDRFLARLVRDPFSDDDCEGAGRPWNLGVMNAHVPVLLDEVRTLLAPRGGAFVDGTVGLGGHAQMLLDGGADRLIGIDRDLRR